MWTVCIQGSPHVWEWGTAQRTGMVEQGPRLAVFRGGDQVPDEAFDVLVAPVVMQAVNEQGPADGLHVLLLQGALVAAVAQDVIPATPAMGERGRGKRGGCS